MNAITESASIAEILTRCPSARHILDRHGLKGCGGEHGPSESLSFFAAVHQVDVKPLLRELNAEMESPSMRDYSYREALSDYIYRRFFKAGIAIALTVGVLWGAVNLLQIAYRGELLQPGLTPSIHAHAHAMIFGWVGLFVMGFAYQSFPRFKYTTLRKPALDNATLFLMLGGIAVRIGAELLQPARISFGLGALSAVAEMAAVGIFITIIVNTARRSMEPHNKYERFIFGAFFWFFVQAIFSDVFFFAKATAPSGMLAAVRRYFEDFYLAGLHDIQAPASIARGENQLASVVVLHNGAPSEEAEFGIAEVREDRGLAQ